MEKPSTKNAIKFFLLAWGVLALIILAKEIFVFSLKGTSWFTAVLFYSLNDLKLISFLRLLFEPIIAMNAFLHDLIKVLFVSYICKDPYGFVINFLTVPIFEELQFRGPFYLLKRYSGEIWWKLVAVVVCLIFAVLHKKGLPALFLIFSLSVANIWLIHKTKRFWPTILLHAVYNMSSIFEGASRTLFM